ncbi:hypothetical protein [Streptomyces phytophilus]|uniref:hypothetical protein n=1 Tax=Streptomyces phytophilus TaxID=722715 RepID=UPI0015F07BB4|nr:hypothetical protein [Streptomyces phytophilus]
MGPAPEAPSSRGSGDAMPLDVGDALAQAVGKQWQKAARQRKLKGKKIPVRWARTRRPVADHARAEAADPAGVSLVRAVPAVEPLEPGEVREGGIPELFAAYGGLASGCLVVLGGPGSGKSDAALLTLLHALDKRAALGSDAERARCPVPLLTSLAGWNGRGLDGWLAARVAEDYHIGRKEAEALVAGGWISLFLDSFDEMGDELRGTALREIDRAAYRVVIFSRPREFEEAVADGHLAGAVAVKLMPVPISDALEFFLGMPSLAPWQRLIEHLDTQPESNISRALNAPLSLTLMRDAFPARHIDDLDELLTLPFSSQRQVEEYLIDRLVKIRYQQEPSTSGPLYDPQQAERWLGYLAHRMSSEDTGAAKGRQRRSFDWRRLHYWASPWPRIAIAALCGLLISVPGGAVAFGPGRYDAYGTFEGTLGGAVYGGVLGILVGAAVGAISELRDPVPQWRARVSRRRGTSHRAVNPAVGALVGLLVAMMALRDPHNVFVWLAGFGAGIASGVLAGYATAQLSGAPRWTGRARWKGFGTWPVLGSGALGGLCIGFAYGLDSRSAGLGIGIGIAGALIIPSIVMLARPTSLADPVTDPHTSWRQDQRFSLLAGLIIGFLIAATIAVRERHADVATAETLWITLGLGPPFALAELVAISDSWRTGLAFLQIRLSGKLPLRGMRFLNDAYGHRILRAEGVRYQFRHALLQDKLARDHLRAEPAARPRPADGTEQSGPFPGGR